MRDIGIEKAENGYIVTTHGKRYIYDDFPGLMRALCIVFEETEFLPDGDKAKPPKVRSKRVKAGGSKQSNGEGKRDANDS